MISSKSFFLKLFFTLFSFFSNEALFAQLDTIPATNQKELLINSTILGEPRTIWVHLPPDYYVANFQTYPVLYLLDGEGHFKYVSELVDFLSDYDRDRTPEMIVVGIVNINRQKDMKPVHPTAANGKTDNDSIITTAGAGKFIRFIIDELVPRMDKDFRTAPYRILAGHSLAGQFALYVINKLPGVFQSTILISPAIFDDNDNLITNLAVFLKTHPAGAGKLFIAIVNENTTKVDRLANQLKTFSSNQLNWSYRKYDDENHFSVSYKALFDALKFIYKNWFIDFYGDEKLTLQNMHAHFEKLSAELGYTIKVNEDFMNNCGYKDLRLGDLDDAIDIFKENVIKFPNSFNVYDSMGEAYMKKGEKKLAIANYEKSILINPQNENGKIMLKKLKGETQINNSHFIFGNSIECGCQKNTQALIWA